MRLSKAQIDEFDVQGYLFFPGAESELLKQVARDVYALEPLADDTLLELAAGDLQTA